MRKVVFGVALAAAMVCAASARAQTIDAQHVTNEPGATLLLPYFEAQVPKKIGGKAPGITTLFSINNASATAILAHVTIWSDLAVPVTTFNVYLTGYDVQTIDMVDILNGKLPVTASAGQDPQDNISNHGIVSQDINFASCNGQLPYPEVLPVESVDHIRAALTGKPSALFNGKCAGRDFAEKKPIARGFITVDTVNNCTVRFPTDAGYFAPGFSGDVTFQNVLWGDYFFIHKSKKIGRGDAMIPVRASTSDPQVTAVAQYTFYTRITSLTASDARQPLGSIFGGRFINVPKHPLFPSGTSALVWRDPKISQQPFDCGTTPAWFPLGQEQLVAFDEQENPQLLTSTPFPAAAQIVKVGGPSLPITPTSGWLYMNLNGLVTGAVSTPAEDPSAGQAFVSMILDAKSKYSVALRAAVIDDAAESDHPLLPLP